jgi:hypothetical protein
MREAFAFLLPDSLASCGGGGGLAKLPACVFLTASDGCCIVSVMDSLFEEEKGRELGGPQGELRWVHITTLKTV